MRLLNLVVSSIQSYSAGSQVSYVAFANPTQQCCIGNVQDFKRKKKGTLITPLELLLLDIEELEDLLTVAARQGSDRDRTDQLKRRLTLLKTSKDELNPTP